MVTLSGHGAPAWLPIPYALAAAALLVLAVIAWQHRGTVASAGAVISLLGGHWWALADTWTAMMVTGRAELDLFPVAKSVSIAAVTLCTIGLWISTRSMLRPDWRPGRGVRWAVLGLTTTGLLVSASSPWTHAVFAELTTLDIGRWWVRWKAGPAFWVFLVAVLVVNGWSVVQLGRHVRDAGGGLARHRAAGWWIGGSAVALPAVGYVWVTRGVIPDVSPLILAVIAGFSVSRAVQAGVFGLTPIARGFVLDRLNDAIVVVDSRGHLIDGNHAGHEMVRSLLPHLPERLTGVLLGPRLEALPSLSSGGHCTLTRNGEGLVLDLGVNDLHDARGALLARAFVMRDVTELVGEREALSTVNGELQEQLRIVEELRAELAEKALRDQLTGLHNRHFLMPQLELAIAKATACGASIAVLLLDVDRFKSVNDQNGHAVGDRLLTAIGAALKVAVASDDHLLARYGGEEFVVVLAGLSLPQVLDRAESYRTACAATWVPGAHGTVSRTLSVGIAHRDTTHGAVWNPSVDAAALLQAADKALYAAKSAGRDRVALGHPN